MNTIGVILSVCCLLVSLIELRMRSDLAGRRMGALLAAAAWLTMGLVALDQHHQCELLGAQQLSRVTTPATDIVSRALRDSWKYETPDGGVITFESAAQAHAQLVGSEAWHVKQNDRL